jgi:hypothetical protein
MPARATAQALLPLCSPLAENGARPRRRRRTRTPPLLPLRVFLPHHRSTRPGRSSSKPTGSRLCLPSTGHAGHRGPRRRALGDDAAGAGASGAQGLLPPRTSRTAMDAPRPQRLWQVHTAQGFSSEPGDSGQHLLFFASILFIEDCELGSELSLSELH